MSLKPLLAAVLLLASGATLSADSFPSKPVTLVIPFSAGGPTDALARILTQQMSRTLKQSVIVENATGAGGTIAMGKVARSAPDGYTIFLHHNGMATSTALYRKLPANPLTDFEYIGLVADVPMVLLARNELPVKNLEELINYIKTNKNTVTLGNAGLGSVSHQCGMLFLSSLQTQITTVPYKGTAPALNDLLGGQIDLLCDQTTSTTSHIRAGKVKVYGATTKERIPSLPNVPTLSEQGMRGFEMYVWHGLFAPKGTPKPVVDKLGEALKEALTDQNVKARLAELGAIPVTADKIASEALRAHVRAEIEKWTPIYKKAGVFAE